MNRHIVDRDQHIPVRVCDIEVRRRRRVRKRNRVIQLYAELFAVRAKDLCAIVAAERGNQLRIRAEQREICRDVSSNAAGRYAHPARIGIAHTRFCRRESADINIRSADDRDSQVRSPLQFSSRNYIITYTFSIDKSIPNQGCVIFCPIFCLGIAFFRRGC